MAENPQDGFDPLPMGPSRSMETHRIEVETTERGGVAEPSDCSKEGRGGLPNGNRDAVVGAATRRYLPGLGGSSRPKTGADSKMPADLGGDIYAPLPENEDASQSRIIPTNSKRSGISFADSQSLTASWPIS